MEAGRLTRVLSPTSLLVGIDDTDNESSPGTGFLAQRLLDELRDAGAAEPVAATRHQLLVDPRVPYTSHNSSACLAVRPAAGVTAAQVEGLAASFLREHSAPGSDPGLALVAIDVDPSDRDGLVDFGQRAKRELLDQPAAYKTAERHGALLSGHGGTQDGVIGALAAVGLHLGRRDGFFLWLPGIRDVAPGRYPLRWIRSTLSIDDARAAGGARPADHEIVEVGPWVRPVLDDGSVVLLLERVEPNGDAPLWRVAPRRVVRQR